MIVSLNGILFAALHVILSCLLIVITTILLSLVCFAWLGYAFSIQNSVRIATEPWFFMQGISITIAITMCHRLYPVLKIYIVLWILLNVSGSDHVDASIS